MMRKPPVTNRSPWGEWFVDLMRGWQLLAVAAILVGVLAFIAPQQVALVAFKAVGIPLSAFLGYWVDRITSPYARPDSDRLTDVESIHALYRRAIIISAAMVAAGLAT